MKECQLGTIKPMIELGNHHFVTLHETSDFSRTSSGHWNLITYEWLARQKSKKDDFVMDRETHGHPRNPAIDLQATWEWDDPARTWCNMKCTTSVAKGSWQKRFQLKLTNPWAVNASEQEITAGGVASQDNEGSAGSVGIYSYFWEMLTNHVPGVTPVIYLKSQQKPSLLQIGQNINHG